ncbi:hypothetical protein [Vibrio splendidus]|uniref:hypothetical protein n=1 Tax=Vibrio splendidus TaxID=29497 RepID=UPI002469B3C0|nr:hypothetical protein [Vibrio splendidus]MDH5885451.1 hypothetical protein [Vibrio splendidus]
MYITRHIELDFAIDQLDISEATFITEKLVDETIHANENIRASRKGQHAGCITVGNEHDSDLYEIQFKSPYEYFGCFEAFYNWIVLESNPHIVKYSISSAGPIIMHRPVLLSAPASNNVRQDHTEEHSEKIADKLCECVIRIEYINIPIQLQKLGIFTALATKFLESYQYILITRVINKEWACSLKRIAVEAYVETSGSNFLLDKSSFSI